MSRLATWQKLALLAVPSILIAAVPAALYLQELQRQPLRSTRAAEGADSVRALLEVVRLMQQHRGLSNGVLSGNAALAAQREAKKTELVATLRAMVTAAARANAAIAADSSSLSNAFASLAAAVEARQLTAPQSFQRHTELIARVLRHLEDWLDFYGLTFEEDPAGHYLVSAAYNDVPALTEAVGQARAHGTAMLSARTPTAQERLFAAALLERATERLAAARAEIHKAAAADRALGERVLAQADAVEVETRAVIALARRELVEATSLTFSATEYFALTTRAIDAQFKLLEGLAAELTRSLASQAQARVRQRNAMLAGGIVLLLLVTTFAYAITRAITRPLSDAVQVAGRIAAGRLDNAILPEGDDEVARLLQALHEMQSQLVGVVSRIQDASFTIREAAAQAAVGNADLSSRTEEQAATLEETAANMEEITTTVRQNAQSAEAAIDLAGAAAENARKGGELVAEMVSTMSAIADGSRRVREITELIDGFAFQTNLLALNAAVEAARAGEHGRGFAVVASEVRGLAQRCARAAQEIRALVQSSTEQVESGRKQAGVAGSAVTGIVRSMQTVAERVRDIASASAQQRAGIEQVNQAVMQMEGVTQQNAALVEEAAANAASLERQAAELSAAVEAFSTGRESQVGAKLARLTSWMAPPAPRLPSTIS